MVCAASRTGGHRAGQRHSLAASALGNDALRTPPVDPAERHFFGLVMPLYALDNFDVPQEGPIAVLLVRSSCVDSTLYLPPR